jgi:hypothetical protein
LNPATEFEAIEGVWRQRHAGGMYMHLMPGRRMNGCYICIIGGWKAEERVMHIK